MKAKVKSLGSVTDLSEYIYDEDGNEYTWDELELIDDDKWQHYHIQASIAAMQTIADALGSVDYNKELIAKHAVELADALIEELKKGGNNEND